MGLVVVCMRYTYNMLLYHYYYYFLCLGLTTKVFLAFDLHSGMESSYVSVLNFRGFSENGKCAMCRSE